MRASSLNVGTRYDGCWYHVLQAFWLPGSTTQARLAWQALIQVPSVTRPCWCLLLQVTKYVEREILNHRCLVHPHIVQFKEVRALLCFVPQLQRGCLDRTYYGALRIAHFPGA